MNAAMLPTHWYASESPEELPAHAIIIQEVMVCPLFVRILKISEHLPTHFVEEFGFPLSKFSAFRSERPDYVSHSLLERGKEKRDSRYDR